MSGALEEYLQISQDLAWGGDWLCAGRSWIQSNIQRGDTITWDSNESVTVPFYKLEELMRRVAVAAVMEDRNKRNRGVTAALKDA